MRVVKDDETIIVYLHSEREKRDMKHLIKALSLDEKHDIGYLMKSKKFGFRNYGRFVFGVKRIATPGL